MNDGKRRATSKNHPVASTRKDKPQATKQEDYGVQGLAKDVVRGVGQAGGALGKAAVQDVTNTPKYIKKRVVNTAGLPRTGGRPGLMGQDAPRGCGLFEVCKTLPFFRSICGGNEGVSEDDLVASYTDKRKIAQSNRSNDTPKDPRRPR
ncbi:hypothetical protein RvY_17759 [Ramazzottius varieornatus]|uniref:Uncharacterized protein n=1 Tax=Ramazzottius varieornatus TaxID=947166 RepID=A0A1D1W5B3_RAMVA|nr:hypothetical protein RvY_17759 [Ramazzottius varieornatus]